jgi:hypothetical protein
MTEFRVTLTDGTVMVYKFDHPLCCATTNDLGQLRVHNGHAMVAAYGPGVWQRFERVAPTAEPAWWPKAGDAS